tara:strand:- start:4330 stop:5094 length:765 start_codon:yes stop_codon:yes gene_type:complete
MGYTSDNIPSGNPFSQEYKDFVAGMARDITDLMRYKSMFDQLSLDILGSGSSGGGSEVFPAAITGNDGNFNTEPFGVQYKFHEVEHPKSTIALTGGKKSISTGELEKGQLITKAFNTLEVGLVDTGTIKYIPPGLSGECFENASPGSGDLEIEFFVQKINGNSFDEKKTVVMMSHFGIVEQFTDVFIDMYYFSCPVALCAGCEGTNGGLASSERQQEELRNTIVTPESVTKPSRSFVDEETQRRGFFRNRKYRQ